MWRTTVVVLVVVFLVACKGSDEAPTKPVEPHWSTRPIKRIEGTAAAYKFSIELPDGMTAKPHGKTSIDYDFGDPLRGLRIRVSEGGPERSLDDMAKMTRDDTVWLRRDSLPDGGFIASYEHPNMNDPNNLIVKRFLPTGDDGIRCFAQLRPWHEGERPLSQLPLAEKICLSMRAD